MKKLHASILCAALMATTSLSYAQNSQDTVDMSAFTCEQLLAGTVDSLLTGVWLSGYFNGVRKNTKLNVNSLQHNSELIVAECKSHPKQTVMQTVETLVPNLK